MKFDGILKENMLILKEGELSIDMFYCVCHACGVRLLAPSNLFPKGADGMQCITEGCSNLMTLHSAGKIKLSDWLNRDNLTMRVEETRDGFYINVKEKDKK